MRIISFKTLREYWENNPKYLDAKHQLYAWYRHAIKANWSTPADVKEDYKNASVLRSGRIVFNIAGNKYRLIVWVLYEYKTIYIKFIGTHKQYDKVDANTVGNE